MVAFLFFSFGTKFYVFFYSVYVIKIKAACYIYIYIVYIGLLRMVLYFFC